MVGAVAAVEVGVWLWREEQKGEVEVERVLDGGWAHSRAVVVAVHVAV